MADCSLPTDFDDVESTFFRRRFSCHVSVEESESEAKALHDLEFESSKPSSLNRRSLSATERSFTTASCFPLSSLPSPPPTCLQKGANLKNVVNRVNGGFQLSSLSSGGLQLSGVASGLLKREDGYSTAKMSASSAVSARRRPESGASADYGQAESVEIRVAANRFLRRRAVSAPLLRGRNRSAISQHGEC